MSWIKTILCLPGWLLVCLALFSGACQSQTATAPVFQPTQTVSTNIALPTRTVTPTHLVLPSPTQEKIAEAATLTSSPESLLSQTPTLELPTATPTLPPSSQFSPTDTPTPQTASGNAAYPGPNDFGNGAAYPGLEQSQPTDAYPGEAGGIFNSEGQVNPTLANTATPPAGAQATTAAATPTPAPVPSQQPTPTYVSVKGFMPHEIPAGIENPSLVIWHSWDQSQVDVLEEIVGVYQAAYPMVSITLTYMPPDALRQSYVSALYQGSAPDLLLGPSDWGASLYDQALVADLSVYFGQEFWQSISAPAVATGKYRQVQVNVPYAMYGVVMYRNRKIISQAPSSVDAFVQFARLATKGGIVGAYLELSAYYSMAHLLGLGGAWLDDAGRPIFDRQGYAAALRWLDLLKALQGAGAVGVNTSRDVSLFQQGKVGIIIDGTWNLSALAQSIGQENLAVDEWPVYGNGRLAGFVQANSVYLNPATALRQDTRLAAALQFMAAMLSPQVQRRLSESGYIPVVNAVQPADALLRQAQLALQSGVAFPPALQGETRLVYWKAVESVIRQAFALEETQPKSPLEALKAAFNEITSRLAR